LIFRGLNPFLKDQLAERDLLNRFNTLIANEQDRQRMAAMSAAYPPGSGGLGGQCSDHYVKRFSTKFWRENRVFLFLKLLENIYFSQLNIMAMHFKF
jgi:hypothetical protein